MAKLHCFTLRLPQDLYIELYELSVSQKKTLNATTIDLIKVALSDRQDIADVLRKLILKEFGPSAVPTES